MATSDASWSPPGSEADPASTATTASSWSPPDHELTPDTQTAAGAAQAAGSGAASGVLDVLGTPVDTALNIRDLGKAGLGYIYHEATGNPIPDALEVDDDRSKEVGSSEWLKEETRRLASAKIVDAQERTTLNKYLHAGGEGVGAGIAGGAIGAESAVAGATKGAVGGALAGTAQQGAADLGADPGTQAAIGYLAGHVAGSIGNGPKTSNSKTVARPPADAGGFTAEDLLREGAARAAESGAGKTAGEAPGADQTADQSVLKALPAPAADQSVLKALPAPAAERRTGAAADTGEGRRIGDEPQDMTATPEQRAARRAAVASQRAQEEGGTGDLEPEPIPRNAANVEGEAARRDAMNDVARAAYDAVNRLPSGDETPEELQARLDREADARGKDTQTREENARTAAMVRDVKQRGPVDIDQPKGKPFSVVSAERTERTPEDNADHTAQLGTQLKATGLPYQPTAGSYQGSHEPSYAVQTPTAGARKQVEQLAAAHDQESVLHVDADRNGSYHYMSDGKQEPMGKWSTASPEEAQAQPGFTKDEHGQHYVMKSPPAPEPLEGLPQKPVEIAGHGAVVPEPSQRVRDVAQNYAKENGVDYKPPTDYQSVDPEKLKGVANAYEAMQHNPNDPAVAASYKALTDETMKQWDAIKKSGLKVDFLKPGEKDPYAASPRLAIEDIQKNNHMFVYPTESGFGSSGADTSDHPMLKDSGEKINGQPAKVNDIFRIVHDYFGHGAEGNGFRADGEYNAWRQHSALYSDAAKPALASETLGQNAWVNFGPHGETNRTANGANTKYADQKAGIMPESARTPDVGAARTPDVGAARTPDVGAADWVAQKPATSGPVTFKRPPPEGHIGETVPSAEQEARTNAFRRLGLDEVRKSAITGSHKETGTDFQTSKLTNSAGDRMTDVMAKERNALRGAANDLVTQSGGSSGLDLDARTARGEKIAQPIKSYNEHLEAQTKAMYEAAKAKSQGKPIQALNEFQNYMKSNKSDFLGTVEGKQLFEGVTARMKELGFLGKNETFHPPTVEQAEALRQYIGEQFTNRTSRIVGKLKDALDLDVAKSAGEDVFAQARAIHALRSKVITEPEGVSSLLPGQDRLGIARPTDLEKIPDHVATMGVEQFGHLVNVIKHAGGTDPKIAGEAAASLNEIRAQFANKVQAAGDSKQGMWDEKSVHQYLQNNVTKMRMVFTPKEMQKFKDLNDAGGYLRMDRTYPGAEAQKQNFAARVAGAAGSLGSKISLGAGAVGSATGFLAGKAAGAAAGGAQNYMAGKNIESRIQKLGQFNPISPGPSTLSDKLPGQRGSTKPNPAADQIKQYLTEPEKAQLRSDTTARMIDAFHSLPDTHELAAAALAGEAKKGWYRDASKAIGNTFGPDAPRFTAVLAAMSPQTSVQANFHNALRTFINWDNAGRPQDPAAIKKIMGQSVMGSGGESSVLNAWVPNTIRALTHPDPESLALSGPKVDSFNQNLGKNVNAVTLDAWMSSFAKILPESLKGSLNKAETVSGKSPTYLAYSAKVREAAGMLSKMTGEKWTPEEVQETVWSWTKSAYEHADSYGPLATIPELVRNKEISDELIKSTPDFHTLFGAPEHADVIGRSRYADNARRVAGEEGSGAQPFTPSKTSAATAKTLEPHLNRAAERLEQVRQERADQRKAMGIGENE